MFGHHLTAPAAGTSRDRQVESTRLTLVPIVSCSTVLTPLTKLSTLALVVCFVTTSYSLCSIALHRAHCTYHTHCKLTASSLQARLSGLPREWRSVASSHDGMKLAAACSNGNIWTSTNAGQNWREVTTAAGSAKHWTCVTASADGDVIVAGAAGSSQQASIGCIWASRDSGDTWSQLVKPGITWSSVCCSQDSTKIIAVAKTGDIWLGRQEGKRTDQSLWVEVSSTGRIPRKWTHITCSADRRFISAVVNGGNIWSSIDSGRSWNENRTTGRPKEWECITASSSGQYIAAVVWRGGIWTSEDYAITWTENSWIAEHQQWRAICCSSDGAQLVAAANAGSIWISYDHGAEWTQIESAGAAKDWSCVACSSDGSMLAATVNGGNIWLSSDSGRSWAEINPTDFENTCSGNREWRSIAMSSEGTKLAAVACRCHF